MFDYYLAVMNGIAGPRDAAFCTPKQIRNNKAGVSVVCTRFRWSCHDEFMSHRPVMTNIGQINLGRLEGKSRLVVTLLTASLVAGMSPIRPT
jgi:hypothetical protein